MSPFNILNSFTAPSGMFWTPDSHRANVRGETSTCRAAFASDKPRDLRKDFSSDPSMPHLSMTRLCSPYPTPPCLSPPYHSRTYPTPPDRGLPCPAAPSQTLPRYSSTLLRRRWNCVAQPKRAMANRTQPVHNTPDIARPNLCSPVHIQPHHARQKDRKSVV